MLELTIPNLYIELHFELANHSMILSMYFYFSTLDMTCSPAGHHFVQKEANNDIEWCAYMYVINFAYPRWYPIPCDKKIHADVICGVKEIISSKYTSRRISISNPFVSNVTCHKGYISFDKNCYKVSRNKKMKDLMTNPQFCTNLARKLVFSEFSKILEYLSKVSHKKPVFYFPASAEANQFHIFNSIIGTLGKSLDQFRIILNEDGLDRCEDQGYIYLRSGFGTADLKLKERKHCIDNERDITTKKSCIFHFNVVLKCITNNGWAKKFTYFRALEMEKKNKLYLGLPDKRSAFYRFSLLHSTFIETRSTDLENVYYISKSKLVNATFNLSTKSLQMFKCSDGVLISLKSLYDGENNCTRDISLPNGACKSNFNGDMKNWTFCRDLCFRINCTCSELYYHKPHGGCSPYSFKKDDLKTWKEISFLHRERKIKGTDLGVVNSKSFMIFTNTTVSNTKQDIVKDKPDFFHKINSLDCTQAEFVTTEFKPECAKPDHMHCTFGCSRCFRTSHMCVYELDEGGNLMHCPSGSHLQSCAELQCNNMFKCYYCIPYR